MKRPNLRRFARTVKPLLYRLQQAIGKENASQQLLAYHAIGQLMRELTGERCSYRDETVAALAKVLGWGLSKAYQVRHIGTQITCAEMRRLV